MILYYRPEARCRLGVFAIIGAEYHLHSCDRNGRLSVALIGL
jgi:hypothetical protein